MSVFYYLLEANAYLVVFYAFYKLALQKETFYTGNRVYLLFTTVLSFTMPFIGLSGLQKPVAASIDTVVPVVEERGLADIVLGGYLAICVVLFLLFVLKLFRIRQLVKRGRVQSEQGIHIVSNPVVSQPFSFMNYLFLNPAIEKAETVIRHEQTHIRQRHSLDLLFFELVQLSSWFNPLLVLMKRDIRALHEFIADKEAASYENNAGDYALFLIRNSYGTSPVLGNTMFNQSLLKMRIMKLNQKRSPGQARMKFLPVLLLVPGMLAVASLSSARPSAVVDLMPQKAESARGVYSDPLTDTVPKAAGGNSARKKSGDVPPPPPVPPRVIQKKKGDVPPPPPPAKPSKKGDVPALPPPPPPARPSKSGDVPAPPPPAKPAKKGDLPAPPPPPKAPRKSDGKPAPASEESLEEVTVVGYPAGKATVSPAAVDAKPSPVQEVEVIGYPTKASKPAAKGGPVKEQKVKNKPTGRK